MSRTLSEVLRLLTERVDPEDIVEIIEPDIEPFVEACADLISDSIDKVNEYLDSSELEKEEDTSGSND